MGGGLWLAGGNSEPPAMPVQLGTVTRGPIEQLVRGTGHVEPLRRVRISARVTGELVTLGVREGERVRQGTVVAVIDVGPDGLIVRQRESSMRALEAEVRMEETRLAAATDEEARVARLVEKTLASEADLVRARQEIQIAAAQLDSARHRMAQARQELEEARARMGQTRLVAPLDGTVLSIERREGERVRGSEFAEDVLMTLAPLDTMQVDVEVGEEDVRHLQEGTPARIKLRALGNLEVAGEVAAIATSATIYNRGQQNELTRFRVSLRMERVPEGLRPGMSAEALLVVRSREDALRIPFEALAARPLNGQKTVPVAFTVEQGRAIARPVVTGLVGETLVEVLEGLREGEPVVVGPFQAVSKELAEGTRVSPLPSAPSPVAATGG